MEDSVNIQMCRMGGKALSEWEGRVGPPTRRPRVDEIDRGTILAAVSA